MGQFTYKAVDNNGRHVAGFIEASDKRAAVASLADRGQLVFEIGDKSQLSEQIEKVYFEPDKWFKFQKVKGKDILAVTSQLSAALRAGLPMLDALEIIHKQQHKARMKEIFEGLAKSVSSGKSLSEAMQDYNEVFNPLYLSMIRVGETGGILEQTTTQLVGILEREEKIKTNMKNASVYPIFVLSVGIISVAIIITWVLPNIIATIEGGAEVLPWPTRFLLGLSGFFKTYGLVVLVAIVLSIYSLRKWQRGEGRLIWDSFKLKVPIFGSVIKTLAVGRFAQTLGALTKGGVGILEALGIVRNTLGNELLAKQIDFVTEKVKTGSPLAEPLNESGYFPPLLVQIVAIGEQTGKLDELLLGAGETFDEDADAAITKFVAIFPAVLILLLAVVIGFIIMAILLPIIQMGAGSGVFK